MIGYKYKKKYIIYSDNFCEILKEFKIKKKNKPIRKNELKLLA